MSEKTVLPEGIKPAILVVTNGKIGNIHTDFNDDMKTRILKVRILKHKYFYLWFQYFLTSCFF